MAGGAAHLSAGAQRLQKLQQSDLPWSSCLPCPPCKAQPFHVKGCFSQPTWPGSDWPVNPKGRLVLPMQLCKMLRCNMLHAVLAGGATQRPLWLMGAARYLEAAPGAPAGAAATACEARARLLLCVTSDSLSACFRLLAAGLAVGGAGSCASLRPFCLPLGLAAAGPVSATGSCCSAASCCS